MKVFIDTNVMIDFLGERELFFVEAPEILSLADDGRIDVYCSSLSYSNAAYVLSRYYVKEDVIDKLSKFHQLCHTTTVDDTVVSSALESDFADFEDALQYYSASLANVDVIVTRDKKHFKYTNIPAMTPLEFITKVER